MKNSRTLFHEVIERISIDEDPDEVRTIVMMLLEKAFGMSKTDIMAGKEIDDTAETSDLLSRWIDRVNSHEPVQYVLGEAFFYGRMFNVNRAVLIPRPETEEIIRAVLARKGSPVFSRADQSVRILDIGTGSGCIPITLSAMWPGSHVFALDVSREAISLARGNAALHHVDVEFFELDILRDGIPVHDLDIVVSNPPYIAEQEKADMRLNVLEFEPHIALFVPDNDPLIFYREIAGKVKNNMRPGGFLAVEINEKYGDEVSRLFINHGWKSVEVAYDLAGKPRIVTAIC